MIMLRMWSPQYGVELEVRGKKMVAGWVTERYGWLSVKLALPILVESHCLLWQWRRSEKDVARITP